MTKKEIKFKNGTKAKIEEWKTDEVFHSSINAIDFVKRHRNIFADRTTRRIFLTGFDSKRQENFFIVKEITKKGNIRNVWFWKLYASGFYRILQFNNVDLRDIRKLEKEELIKYLIKM